MATCVVDKDILGWSDDSLDEIARRYSKIIKVGGKDSELAEDTPDPIIAQFCYDHKCDLFTGDKKLYTDFFENEGVTSVRIDKFAYWKTGKKPIFLIKIL